MAAMSSNKNKINRFVNGRVCIKFQKDTVILQHNEKILDTPITKNVVRENCNGQKLQQNND